MVQIVCQTFGFESGTGNRIGKKRKLPDSEAAYLPAKRIKLSPSDEVLDDVINGSRAFEAAAHVINLLLEKVVEVEAIPEKENLEEPNQEGVIATIISDLVKRALEASNSSLQHATSGSSDELNSPESSNVTLCESEAALLDDFPLEILNELIEKAVCSSDSEAVNTSDDSCDAAEATLAGDNRTRIEESADASVQTSSDDLGFLSQLLDDLVTKVVAETEAAELDAVEEEEAEDKFLIDILMSLLDGATKDDGDAGDEPSLAAEKVAPSGHDEISDVPSRRTRSKLKPEAQEPVQALLQDIDPHRVLKVVLTRLEVPSISFGSQSPGHKKPSIDGKSPNPGQNKRKQPLQNNAISPKRKRPNGLTEKSKPEPQKSSRSDVQPGAKAEQLSKKAVTQPGPTRARGRSIAASPKPDQSSARAVKVDELLKPVVRISAAERAKACQQQAAGRKVAAQKQPTY